MIASAIRQLCAVSILCGAALSIAPEGVVKRVLEIVCSVVVISAVFQPLIGLDLTAYALELARTQELEAELEEQGTELNDRLNRLVIEERCGTYIMDKAQELGVELSGVWVTARWSLEGYWLPWSAELTGEAGDEQRAQLAGKLEAELGIPAERQQWSGDESTEG